MKLKRARKNKNKDVNKKRESCKVKIECVREMKN